MSRLTETNSLRVEYFDHKWEKPLINHKKVNYIGQTTNSWSLEGENGTSNWESEIWTVCPCFLKILVNVIDFQNVGFELIITL